MSKVNVLAFLSGMVSQLVTNEWLLGKPEDYNRVLARCNGAELIKERGAT
ncbi:MAG: hypothetical protein RPR28_06475 [Cycloclasticus sp.]|jgi:hypothetical protein